MKRRLGIACMMLFAAALLFSAGQTEVPTAQTASDFPSREVRIIVPYNPGGQSDVMARMIGSVIEKEGLFDEPVVVTNIAGAGTRDGLRAVQDATADGHTVLFHHSAMLTLSSLDLIPWKYTDFTVISQVAQAPMVAVTRSQSPYNGIDDLIEAAKANPGKVSVAIQGGLGSNAHFITEMIIDTSGAEFRRIAYPGGTEARAAILGGHVDWYVTSLTESIPYVNSGDFKVLGISSDVRQPGLEDIPTLVEQGYDIVFNIHSSIFGPKDMPDSIRDKWASVLAEVTSNEEYKKFMASVYTQPKYLDSSDAEAAYADQWVRIKAVSDIVRKAGQ